MLKRSWQAHLALADGSPADAGGSNARDTERRRDRRGERGEEEMSRADERSRQGEETRTDRR